MAAHHRFVLSAPPGTVIPPYHAVFAKLDKDAATFRGDQPVLTLAGTHLVNMYHWDTLQEQLNALGLQKRQELSAEVEKMIAAKSTARNIQDVICYALGKLALDHPIRNRLACSVYVEQDAMFLGISIGQQTPGHLQGQSIIEVHTVVAGCCRLRLDHMANLQVGDAVFGEVPLFKKRTRPLCYVVAGVSENEVLVSVDAHDILTTAA